jgi:hypothetical protein
MDKLIGREVAILAREKGFNEVCYYFHSPEFSEIENGKYHRNSKMNIKGNKLFPTDYVTAPTQSLLQAWLRDNHNIFIEVQIDCTTYPKFCYEIKRFIGNPKDLASEEWGWEKTSIDDWGLYRTYELALEDALKDGLNLIK